MFEIKSLVQETCKLQCVREHDGQMAAIYETFPSGFKFPVPISDMSNGTFNAEERGFTLMRWIKKAIKVIETPSIEESLPG